MDVLRIIAIVYKAYENASQKNRLHEGINTLESFQGIMIESYYGIFCHKIHTRFGCIKVSNGNKLFDNTDTLIEEYIKSRITYHVAINKVSNRDIGCIGPFYLVTHIDGAPIEHACIDGLSPETFYEYVVPNHEGREQYSAFIRECMVKKFIRDKEGIIDSLLLEPESYPDLVKYLIEEPYVELVGVDEMFHLFQLLLRKNMLLF